MGIKELQEQIDIWDKWSYDTENECFVFFTLHDEWEDGHFFYCRYKAKAWINQPQIFGLPGSFQDRGKPADLHQQKRNLHHSNAK